jgi:hypothetical protein
VKIHHKNKIKLLGGSHECNNPNQKRKRVELVHNVQNGNFKPITQVIRTYGYLTRGCEFNPLFDHLANYYSIQPTHLLFRFRV